MRRDSSVELARTAGEVSRTKAWMESDVLGDGCCGGVMRWNEGAERRDSWRRRARGRVERYGSFVAVNCKSRLRGAMCLAGAGRTYCDMGSRLLGLMLKSDLV